MVLLQPPSYCESQACYTPQQDRLLWNSIICEEGVTSGLEVTAGTGMSVLISAGAAFIQGEVQAQEGMYWVQSTDQESRTIQPSDPVDPRYDLVVAQINTDCTWSIDVITGAASPNPPIPPTPPNSVPLKVVRIEAGATTVTVQGSAAVAQLCDNLLPVPSGWITLSEGDVSGSDVQTGTIAIPNPDRLRYIRGRLFLNVAAEVNVCVRLNGISAAGSYRSSYRSWDPAGAVAVNGTAGPSASRSDAYYIGKTYANRAGLFQFDIQADNFGGYQKILQSRYSAASTTDTSSEYVSGMGEGRMLSSITSVTSIQAFRSGSSIGQMTWLIEGYYQP